MPFLNSSDGLGYVEGINAVVAGTLRTQTIYISLFFGLIFLRNCRISWLRRMESPEDSKVDTQTHRAAALLILTYVFIWSFKQTAMLRQILCLGASHFYYLSLQELSFLGGDMDLQRIYVLSFAPLSPNYSCHRGFGRGGGTWLMAFATQQWVRGICNSVKQ